MRTSLKCLVFYLIIGVILLNLYFLGQLYFQHQSNTENDHQQQQQQHQHEDHHHHQPNPHDIFREIHHREEERLEKPSNNAFSLKNSNEFLVLDWTGHQHIFREQDPIQCMYRLVVKSNICCQYVDCSRWATAVFSIIK